MMTPSNQMFSAVSALKERGQRLYIYDVFEKDVKWVLIRDVLGKGYWSAPWILPIGLDCKQNLIVTIIDANDAHGVRLIQRSFDMISRKIRWSIEMTDAIAATPWESQLYNDHCCGYVLKRGDRLYAHIYDTDKGHLISTIGHLPKLLNPAKKRWHFVLTSFLFIFQDQSKSLDAAKSRSTTLSNPTPMYFYRLTTGEMLYRIDPPVASPVFESPRSWIYRGEDALERYIILKGVGEQDGGIGWPERLDGSKKWLILDTVRGEWVYVVSVVDGFVAEGMHVLYREGGDDSASGLRFQYARINIPVHR
jgi:hypothetical protein